MCDINETVASSAKNCLKLAILHYMKIVAVRGDVVYSSLAAYNHTEVVCLLFDEEYKLLTCFSRACLRMTLVIVK